MSEYLDGRSDAALDLLIRRLQNKGELTNLESGNLESARRILAERAMANVAPHFDIQKAVAFLTVVAKEKRLCSYKELAEACIHDPTLPWNAYRRRIEGPSGLMQSIIRKCDADSIPPLSALVVRQSEVAAGPWVAPDRDGEAEYGFKRGMVDEGLVNPSESGDDFVIESRRLCFEWASMV